MTSRAQLSTRLPPEPRPARRRIAALAESAKPGSALVANAKVSARAASVIAGRLRCLPAEQFLGWVESVSPKVTTAEGLLAAFCKDCLPAFKRQMKGEERCIHHQALEKRGAASQPGPRRPYRQR